MSDADELNRRLATRLLELRAMREWSLDELVRRSQVSKGMLVQIEGAKTNPSIGTLVKIANAFEVGVPELLGEESQDLISPVPEHEQALLWQTAAGSSARLIGGITKPAIVELWTYVLASGESHSSPGHPPGTREILQILSGSLVVTSGEESCEVTAPTGVVMAADRAHSYANRADQSVVFTMVVCEPGSPRVYSPVVEPP
jgi:transcriptional regulator with XRE-family HTH domain